MQVVSIIGAVCVCVCVCVCVRRPQVWLSFYELTLSNIPCMACILTLHAQVSGCCLTRVVSSVGRCVPSSTLCPVETLNRTCVSNKDKLHETHAGSSLGRPFLNHVRGPPIKKALSFLKVMHARQDYKNTHDTA